MHPPFALLHKISHADSGVVGAGVGWLDDHDTMGILIVTGTPGAARRALLKRTATRRAVAVYGGLLWNCIAARERTLAAFPRSACFALFFPPVHALMMSLVS